MKSLMFFLLLVSGTCFTQELPSFDTPYFSSSKFAVIQIGWEMTNEHKYSEAIDLMSSYIDDPNTENVDRIHYLIARSSFHCMTMDTALQVYDMILVGNLCRKYPECMEEKIKYYRYLDEY